MNELPAPPKFRKAKAAAVTAAAIAATAALTIGGATAASNAVLADRDLAVSKALGEDVSLSASIGVYPTGPLFQAARLAGLGNPDAALNSLQNLAALLGQDGLANTIETIRGVLANLPVDLVDARVPGFGPAGIIEAAGSLEGDGLTKGLLSALKSVLLNAENIEVLAPALAALDLDLPPELVQYLDLVANLPLNVPGTSAEVESGLLNDLLEVAIPDFPGLSVGGFLSDADKLAVIPAWGLGGTNFALASPTFLNDPEFANTAILGLLLRNTSRPGGGIVAMLNPFSQLVGLNLANMDGRGTPVSETHGISFSFLGWEIDLVDTTITEYDGNLTAWDITAAYDLLSDAPSTIFNPVAWANSAAGFAMPTYLIPSTITQILDGDILGGLLDSLDMLKIDVSEHDGNLYITYDSGNLPLLEPVQFLPRTLSYFLGFDISTPVSSSFEQALRTLVATGYQDVKITDTDGDGVYSFERGWDMGGSQAYFWENPINFTQGLEVPQTVLNEIVDGLSANMLNPEDNNLELFGNDTLTTLLYDNDLAIAAAKFIRDGLKQLMATLNPIINDIQEPLKELTGLLDDATAEVNTLIRDGLTAGAANPIIDLEGPLLDANRFVNDLTGPLDNGIPNVVGDTANAAGSSAEMMESTAPEPKKAADALNPGTAPATAAAETDERVEKRLTKTQNSLRKANERGALVGDKLRNGDLTGAAKQVGDNIANRADRVKRDINNGVSKITGKTSGDSENPDGSTQSSKPDRKKDAA